VHAGQGELGGRIGDRLTAGIPGGLRNPHDPQDTGLDRNELGVNLASAGLGVAAEQAGMVLWVGVNAQPAWQSDD
jgi:hypothetical protein